MRKSILILGILALFGIGCSQQPSQEGRDQAAQQAPPVEPVEQIAEGDLARVDAQQHLLWVKSAEGREMQFSYSDATKIAGANDSIQGLATMRGNHLVVHFRTAAGVDEAVNIEVQGREGATAAPAAAQPSREPAKSAPEPSGQKY